MAMKKIIHKGVEMWVDDNDNNPRHHTGSRSFQEERREEFQPAITMRTLEDYYYQEQDAGNSSPFESFDVGSGSIRRVNGPSRPQRPQTREDINRLINHFREHSNLVNTQPAVHLPYNPIADWLTVPENSPILEQKSELAPPAPPKPIADNLINDEVDEPVTSRRYNLKPNTSQNSQSFNF